MTRVRLATTQGDQRLYPLISNSAALIQYLCNAIEYVRCHDQQLSSHDQQLSSLDQQLLMSDQYLCSRAQQPCDAERLRKQSRVHACPPAVRWAASSYGPQLVSWFNP